MGPPVGRDAAADPCGTEILERFERIEVQAEPGRTLSSFVHGYTSLPVTVTRK